MSKTGNCQLGQLLNGNINAPSVERHALSTIHAIETLSSNADEFAECNSLNETKDTMPSIIPPSTAALLAGNVGLMTTMMIIMVITLLVAHRHHHPILILMATKDFPCHQLHRWKRHHHHHHHSLLLEQGGQINHLLVVVKNAMTMNVIAGRQQMTSMAPLTPPPPPMAPKHRRRHPSTTPTNPMASIRKIPTATNRQTIKHQILSKISVTGFLS
eukprot:scaffold1390_cov61-Skeletonema_dohrnii-CCMP3373.AAC.1